MCTALQHATTFRGLEAAGFERVQAEAIASSIDRAGARATTKADFEPLATKAELEPLASKAELASLATKAELSEVETRLLL